MKRVVFILLLAFVTLSAKWSSSEKKTPNETLTITQTETGENLRGYLWLPKDYKSNQKYPAVVLVHGCGGAHYKDDSSYWNAKYLAGKYKVWGKLLRDNGFIVFLVDSFTTRDNDDVGKGVCHTKNPLERPSKIDPISIRPGDIASAIAYLKSRDDIKPNKVGVLSFSNGATAALVFSNHKSLINRYSKLKAKNKKAFNLPFEDKYKASKIIALYPGCGLNGYSEDTRYIFKNKFETDTDTYLFMASNDTVLPKDTKEKCTHLEELDSHKTINAPTMKLQEVPDTDHQFDYYENNEQPVINTINTIIYIFKSM